MAAVAADTHAVLWYLKEEAKLSPAADLAFRMSETSGDPIYVSVITLVEICYLIEKGRLPFTDWSLLTSAISNGVKTNIELVPFSLAVATTVPHIPRDTVPDMPDRIIAATAMYLGVPLVSRDRKIQAASIQTIW